VEESRTKSRLGVGLQETMSNLAEASLIALAESADVWRINIRKLSVVPGAMASQCNHLSFLETGGES
jgi:hypothetical protein